MPRRTDSLSHLSVSTPCSADWDSMLGNDQVRLCRHCNLDVHNLSAMTRRDALRLVRRSEGRLCVRYHRRADGSNAYQDAPLERLHQVSQRASKFVAGAFGAALGLSAGAAAAQTQPPPVTAGRSALERALGAGAGAVTTSEDQGASLVGTIFDPNVAVIPGAAVALLNTETRQEQTTTSNDEGVYRFDGLHAGTYTLRIESPGFTGAEVPDIRIQPGGEFKSDSTLSVSGPQETVDVILEVGNTQEVLGAAVFVEPEDPVVKAALKNDLAALKELVFLGGDVNVLDEGVNTTALMQAAEHNNLEMVRVLVGAGANVNQRNNGGQTALMSLSDEGGLDVLWALLSAGAKVNLKDEEGYTALMFAAARDDAEVLKALLNAGARVNAKTGEGLTALMMAAREGNVENVRALLAAGADPGTKNDEGSTALDMAREKAQEDVADLLVAYGASE